MKLVFLLLLAATSSIVSASEQDYKEVLNDCIRYKKAEDVCATAGNFEKCMSIKYGATKSSLWGTTLFDKQAMYGSEDCKKVATYQSKLSDSIEAGRENAEKERSLAYSALTAEQQQILQDFNAWPLKITFNNENPKIAYVNGAPISDENGYRTVGWYSLRNYQDTAKHMGKEFPMQIIPPKPGVKYD
jgi:hypothetical protein